MIISQVEESEFVGYVDQCEVRAQRDSVVEAGGPVDH
jgi:hypothetical protein